MDQTLNIARFIAGLDIEPDEFMLPLNEVIVNAIQGIEDKISDEQGKIIIKINRGTQLSLEGDFTKPYMPIIGFEVSDNGIGFISKRFQSFNDAFTDINKDKGCKGIGRYNVIACFSSMEISSTFFENKNWYKRDFRFNIQGISPKNSQNPVALKKGSLNTIIKLNNYQKAFQDVQNKNIIQSEDIAERIIQHCLLYFINKEVPLIELYDENYSKCPILVNDLYSKVVKFDKEVKSLKLKNLKQPINLNYLRNYKNKTHSFHLCANKREVGKKTSISTYIPSFVQNLMDENNEKYHLSVYVTSNFLDEKANNPRNKFSIPKKDEDKGPFDEISLDELLKDISNNVRTEYFGLITSADIEKNNRIKNYILNPEKPRLSYKHLLSVENIFEDIPANATDERIEAELHKKVFHLEQKRSKAFEKAFAKKKYDKKEFSEIIQNVLKEEAAFSIGKLADLMVRRKTVIKLFRQYLNWREEGEYMLEEDLHNIIFTMGAETETMPRDYHNLWLLDERLAFHSYATSDRTLKSNKHISSNSHKETDLLIYDFPWAYADNPNRINSLVVFEFKRPGRDMNTTKDKKLDLQVAEYFEKLMDSKSQSDKGKFLNIQDNTPKFGYIICDLHKELSAYNIKHNFFKQTPYGTLFKINPELNQYFEVMDYETMIEFAEKRHTAFFQALGIENL